MTSVIVAGSTNNFTFAVIDFTTPGSPSVVQVNPGYGGGSTVAINGSNAVAGNINGGQVRLVDVSNPAAPVLKGMINTTLLGISAIAIRGTRVAVGEQNGGHIALLDFSAPMSPTLVANKLTGSGAFSSLAFIADSIVVASGPNDFTATQVDFTNLASPVVTTFNPALAGSPSLDADAAANHIAVGDTSGVNVKLIDGTSKAALGTATTTINSVASVAVAGSLVLAGGPNSFNVARINFAGGPAVTSFSPGYSSGSVVAIDGTFGVCGQIVSAGVTHVNLVDLTPTPPAILGSVNSGIDSIVTLAMSSFTSGPPPTPAVTYSPLSLAFGAVRVGTTSAPLSLTLHNVGGAALSITNIQSSSPFFTFSPAGPLTIAPAGNAVLQVRFAPNVEAPFSGNLTMHTNDPAHLTVTVPMSGTGGLPHISLSAGSLAFGDVAICLSKPLTLSIHNSGAVALTVSAIGTGGPPFSVSPSNLVVGAGATLPVTVTYTPTALGPANGSLTITCDDPANAHPSVTLSGNGLPTPPPAISVSPTSLNFGPTPLQYWIGLWVTVANTSPCQALSVDLATSGTPFFVTDGLPTTVTPTSVPVHQDIPGNTSHKFAVIFSATTLGAANGVLTITSNDPANPTVTVSLTGNGVPLAPAVLELVLDRSGSMAAAAPGGTKMEALKAAVHLFADLVIPSQGNEMGSVEFDDAFAPLTPPGDFDVAKQQAIETGVDTLTPRNFTCIGGGLQLGQSQLSPSVAPRKVILVFTDGLENRSPLVSSVESSIVQAGTEVYAIGLGQPQNISGAVLSELASSSQGNYFQTDDTLVLRKHFV